MGASITLAGESLIAQKQGNGQILDVTQIIFGYIPGLDTTLPVDRTAGFPVADDVVHTMNITRKGYLSPNQVVYSALLGSDIGDFDFNWMGLSTAEGTLLIAAYVPTQQKRREIPPLQTGNNLTRNIVLEYDGAQGLTGITVPASTWQFDFSTEFAAIRQDIAALKVAVVNAASAVSLDGPVLIYPNSANVYKITDYNRFSVFTATTSVGSVTIAADTLTLNIPAGAATGIVVLEVSRDGVKAPFKVALGASAIGAPTITSPANLAVGVALATTLTTTAFVAYPATADTHKDTDWRVKNAAGDLVWQSLANSANKTSITLPANALQPGVQYFPEARHNGAALGSSPYSPLTKFTTSAVSITTPTILSPINGSTGIEETPTFTLSAFATVPAASDTHKSTSWRLRNAAGDVVWSSLNDIVNLLKLKLPAGVLVVAKNHTIEWQFNGVTLPSTPWQSSGFITSTTFAYEKYLAVAQTVSPYILMYGQDVDTFKKLPAPQSLPDAESRCSEFSSDGTYLAVGGSSSLTLYKREGDELLKIQSPSLMPNGIVNGLAFSNDGLYLAVAHSTGTRLTIYKREGDVFSKIPDPDFIIPSAAYGVTFSNDGALLAVAHAGGDYLTIFKLVDGKFYKSTKPRITPSGTCRGVSFSPDDAYLAAVGDGIVNNNIYRITGGEFDKLSISDFPTGDKSSVRFSNVGDYLAVTCTIQPFVYLYKRTGDFFNRINNIAALPGTPRGCAFSNDGGHLALAHAVSPYLTVYKKTTDTSFVKLANPEHLPAGEAFSVAFYPPKLGI